MRRSEREWVGVAFRLSAENFLVAREETREVLGFPSVVTRVPGAKTWIRGIANVRGQLLPVVDLRAFLGGGATNTGRSTRVLVANHREVPAGLLVDEVLGLPPLRRRRVFRRRRRRRSRAASAISPARSAAARRAGRCSVCARCSKARNFCRRRPRRRAARVIRQMRDVSNNGVPGREGHRHGRD